jgi:hypothetical protein
MAAAETVPAAEALMAAATLPAGEIALLAPASAVMTGTAFEVSCKHKNSCSFNKIYLSA